MVLWSFLSPVNFLSLFSIFLFRFLVLPLFSPLIILFPGSIGCTRTAKKDLQEMGENPYMTWVFFNGKLNCIKFKIIHKKIIEMRDGSIIRFFEALFLVSSILLVIFIVASLTS